MKNKGFIKELSRPSTVKSETKRFDYSKSNKPVTEALATPHRLREHKSVKPDKTTNICLEHAEHVRKRNKK